MELDLINCKIEMIKEIINTPRIYNVLKRNNINTLFELVTKTEEQLKQINSLGETSLDELKRITKKYNLFFKGTTGYEKLMRNYSKTIFTKEIISNLDIEIKKSKFNEDAKEILINNGYNTIYDLIKNETYTKTIRSKLYKPLPYEYVINFLEKEYNIVGKENELYRFQIEIYDKYKSELEKIQQYNSDIENNIEIQIEYKNQLEQEIQRKGKLEEKYSNLVEDTFKLEEKIKKLKSIKEKKDKLEQINKIYQVQKMQLEQEIRDYINDENNDINNDIKKYTKITK